MADFIGAGFGWNLWCPIQFRPLCRLKQPDAVINGIEVVTGFVFYPRIPLQVFEERQRVKQLLLIDGFFGQQEFKPAHVRMAIEQFAGETIHVSRDLFWRAQPDHAFCSNADDFSRVAAFLE